MQDEAQIKTLALENQEAEAMPKIFEGAWRVKYSTSKNDPENYGDNDGFTMYKGETIVTALFSDKELRHIALNTIGLTGNVGILVKKIRWFLIAFIAVASLNSAFAQNEYERADKELNEVYQKVMEQVPSNQKEVFKKIQRQWIKYKDKSCKTSNQPEKCLAEETLFRTKRLLTILEKESGLNECSLKESHFTNQDKSVMTIKSYYCNNDNIDALFAYKVFKDNHVVLDSKYILIDHVNDWMSAHLEDLTQDGFSDLVIASIPYTKSVDYAFFIFDQSKNQFSLFLRDNAYGYEVVEDYILTFYNSYVDGHTNATRIKNFIKNAPKNIYATFNRSEEGNINCQIKVDINITISKTLRRKLCQK